MTENTTLPPEPGTFHWHLIHSSVLEEEQIPYFADQHMTELISIRANRITRKARVAILRSMDALLSFKHSYLGTEHLLLGILMTPDEKVSALFKQLGLDRVQLLSAFESELVSGAEPKPEFILLTSSCKQAIDFAEEEAFRLHQQQIASEHLLVGISCEGSGIAGTFLQHCGLTCQELRHNLSLNAEG